MSLYLPEPFYISQAVLDLTILQPLLPSARIKGICHLPLGATHLDMEMSPSPILVTPSWVVQGPCLIVLSRLVDRSIKCMVVGLSWINLLQSAWSTLLPLPFFSSPKVHSLLANCLFEKHPINHTKSWQSFLLSFFLGPGYMSSTEEHPSRKLWRVRWR